MKGETRGPKREVSQPFDGQIDGLDASVGAQVRYPVASRGALDLVAIGGLSFSWGSGSQESNGPGDNEVATVSRQNLGASLGYGLGIEWFLGHGLALSADAQNPLVGWSRTTVVNESRSTIGDTPRTSREETSNSGFNWGLIFQPQIRVLMHLYF